MTNNNTPRLLPQLQPGSSSYSSSSSASASATSPWSFCYSRHTRSSDSSKSHHHPLKTHSIPYTPQSPSRMASDPPPDVAHEPIDTFPSVLETPSPPSPHDMSKRRNKRKAEEEKKKERSKRRRGESHYKRKVEKPRGPPAWLLKPTQTSIHPPLPTTTSSSTSHQLPAAPGPSPTIIPTNALTSTTSPIIVRSPSYSIGPTTSLPEEIAMTPLWMVRPALPLSSTQLLGDGATISSNNWSSSLPFNPFLPGSGGYAISRRSSEPALALGCIADPLPTGYSMLPAALDNHSETVPLTSYRDQLAVTLSSSSQSSASVGTSIDNSISMTYADVLSYHPPFPLFEAHHPQISNPHAPLTMRSLEPNFERYPGGKYLKYS
ncbi:hypothetical protein I302_107118 [Kwoniella bestiolae CBS 10118]|uniref:Uncharacterized protein n=1 Tax=Kwoniella bestiolae CBS 10118 TaxID=1296100 RepID=A0A1B9FZG2_9TREE|nr:hypothetical protein I302_05616 [Kwoniella bestiolae CBS 10118]OCF24157.1 hypothetical protein I302_05616 [Kwoniella bestiolae CBS 10118]